MDNREAMIKDCGSSDEQKQVEAIRALKEQRAHEAVPVILPLLSSASERVRHVAATALGYLGQGELDRVGPPLMAALDDPSDLVRGDAAEALGIDLKYRPALERLGEMLIRDPSWVVRCSCAEALGGLGDPRAIDLLWPALQDPMHPVRNYAATSLGLLGTAEILPRLAAAAAAEHDLDPLESINTARYMIGDQEALQSLLDLINEPDPEDATLVLSAFYGLEQWNRTPPTLATDLPRIREALTALARRLPDTQEQVDKILTRLAEQFPEAT